MLAYKNRTPDMTLAKLKHHERQTYPKSELKHSQTLTLTVPVATIDAL